jgi:MerR family mercuric resistance operon transcriptional regulator
MRIGEIARQAAVNVQTVRFYEREGLLRKPVRTPGGYRSYEHVDLERVAFIKACQGLGFTLREVKHLIRLHRVITLPDRKAQMSPQAVKEILSIAEERVASIEEKMKALSTMRSEMQSVIRALSGNVSPQCPAMPVDGSSRKAKNSRQNSSLTL